jgi:hypothetical protein
LLQLSDAERSSDATSSYLWTGVLIRGFLQHVLQQSLQGGGLHGIMAPVRNISTNQTIRNISCLNGHKFTSIAIIIIVIVIIFILGLEHNPFTICPQVGLDVADDR